MRIFRPLSFFQIYAGTAFKRIPRTTPTTVYARQIFDGTLMAGAGPKASAWELTPEFRLKYNANDHPPPWRHKVPCNNARTQAKWFCLDWCCGADWFILSEAGSPSCSQKNHQNREYVTQQTRTKTSCERPLPTCGHSTFSVGCKG
jgi:hypothetical protein